MTAIVDVLENNYKIKKSALLNSPIYKISECFSKNL